MCHSDECEGSRTLVNVGSVLLNTAAKSSRIEKAAMIVTGVGIHWPSGRVEKLKLPAVDRIFTVEEGKGGSGDFCPSCTAAKK